MKKSIDLIKSSLFVFMNRFNTGNNNPGNNPENNPGNNPGNNPRNRPGSNIVDRDPDKEQRDKRRHGAAKFRKDHPEEHQINLADRREKYRINKNKRRINPKSPNEIRDSAIRYQESVLRKSRIGALDLNPDNADGDVLSQRMQPFSQTQS